MLRNIYFALFLFFCCAACDSPIEEQEFFTVSLDPLGPPNNLKRLALRANVGALSERSVESCGFYWSTSDVALIDPLKSKAPSIASQPPVNSGKFEAGFEDLQPSRTYYFRAFAQLGDRRVLSEETRAFSLDQIVALSDRLPQVYNDTAIVYGRTIGLDTLTNRVARHGHVFSSTVRIPEVGITGCDTSNLGEKRGDGLFVSRLRLQFNTTYYYRAYVTDATGNTRYSSRTDTIRIRDGWVSVTDFPTFLKDASAVNWQGQGFVGFGCANITAGNCYDTESLHDFRSYQPSSTLWRDVEPLNAKDVINRTNTCMFVIGNAIYVIGGNVFIQNDKGEDDYSLISDFWKYVPVENKWYSCGDVPDDLQRTEAFVFVVEGKAYVGGGNIYDQNANIIPTNSFWEYDPSSNRWRQVAPLPLNIKGDNNVRTDIGRTNAIAFAIGSLGYAGGGQERITHLPDFWAFTPPTSTTDLGKWTYVGTLPGPLRTEAVAFAIGNKGYYGTGFSYERGYLRDFYEFEPGKGWRTRTPLPGVPRAQAFGFGVGNRGYLGTGIRRIQRGTTTTFTGEPLRDMWQYIPEQ
jgi:N-acetylneuraminic acid mutarotase